MALQEGIKTLHEAASAVPSRSPGGVARDFLEMGKPAIALATVVSALPGYFLYLRSDAGWNPSVLVSLLTGLFLLSFAAGSLNNLQDASLDGSALRTKNRPLPAGRIGRGGGLVWTLFLLVAGILILITGTNKETTLFGIVALVLYNGIYTPLKRISVWAIFPGTLTGAMAPLMGHAAVNGSWDLTIFWIVGFYIMWQIPHVFLILLRHGRSHSGPQIPTMLDHLSQEALARIACIWILFLDVYVLMVPLFLDTIEPYLFFSLLLAAAWMTRPALALFRPSFFTGEQRKNLNRIFFRVNLFSLVVGACLLLPGASS